ncbi:glycosyltransferase family 2 protein [Mangrovimonas spongiae]|uniref:Glycosyltransferase family 2 protein n=1 Tax=Mangrovimonas spongiae TaxID=2494697 RepID=A0A428K2D7_9FLAO|nr:glycosyltransferase family 2 protein [Mangrovimonas spongiae]RSK40567.1 glycosyltransferase family 2 protein [Mangrovimonas spongiae]
MKLSVVILNYNVRYFLELCLTSVREAIKDIDAEIIVVDNHSPDDSCQMIKNNFPEVILIENKENLGFSKGNNIGVSKAKGEYVCVLNPDTVVTEDTFKTLLQFSDTQEKLGIVGCKLIDGTGTFLPESKRNIPTPKVALYKMLGFSKQYYANQINQSKIGEVPILVGAFMLLKTSIYKEVGGFDEDYFMYGEDVDLSYKVLKSGYKNFYNGTTTVIHYKGESTLKDVNYAKRFYGAMQIFYKKHFKRHMLFDVFVWLGIKLAYLLRKTPEQVKTQKKNVVFISQSDNVEKVEQIIKRNVLLGRHLNTIENDTEVIFDGNTMTFKSIIQEMMVFSDKKAISFKILPKNATFILGSDSSKFRGEIIALTNN